MIDPHLAHAIAVTVVQDASHVSEAVSLAPGLGANAECTYDSQGVGACTLVVEGAGTDTNTDAEPSTMVVSTSLSFLAVPVTTAAPTSTQPSASGPASGSASADSPDNTSSAARGLTFPLVAAVPIILAGISVA